MTTTQSVFDKKVGNAAFWIAVLAIPFLMTIAQYVVKEQSSSETAQIETQAEQLSDKLANAQSYSYTALYRHPELYKGYAVRYTGQVVQFDPTRHFIRLAVTKNAGYWSDEILLTYSGNGRFLSGDIVEITGIVTGIAEFENIAGVHFSVPQVKAYEVVLVQG